jgi:hypothetical protein
MKKVITLSKSSFTAEMLKTGKTILKYKEAGNSMLPIIKSNQPVTLEPVIETTALVIGDIVFCKVNGKYYTHLISGIP